MRRQRRLDLSSVRQPLVAGQCGGWRWREVVAVCCAHASVEQGLGGARQMQRRQWC